LEAATVLAKRCVYPVKDTNRKQFTTHLPALFSGRVLCLSCH